MLDVESLAQIRACPLNDIKAVVSNWGKRQHHQHRAVLFQLLTELVNYLWVLCAQNLLAGTISSMILVCSARLKM